MSNAHRPARSNSRHLGLLAATADVSTATPRPSGIRTRWAAIGAAIAVTLGAGGIGFADAAPTTPDQVKVTGLDFMPVSSNFQTGTNVGRHTLQGHIIVNEFADGANRCATASLDLPDDTHLKAVQVRYSAPQGAILQSQVARNVFAEQPIPTEWSFSDSLAESIDDVKPSTSIRTVTLEVGGVVVENEKSNYDVTICSDRVLTVHGALAHLG